MKRHLIPGLILSLALLITFVLYQQISAATSGNPLLWVNPATPNLAIGETVTVTIQLDQATDVFALEMAMTYDPSVIQIVDADPGTNGIQVTLGDCPAPDFVIQNMASNITGTLDYAVTQLSIPGCAGGTVAQVAFQGIANGVSPFTFESSLIADTNGISVTHTTQAGWISVGPTPTPTETPFPTNTFTPTPTATGSRTPTNTPTHTNTPTPTFTNTPTPTNTATPSPTLTQTGTAPEALLSLQPESATVAYANTTDLALQLDNATDVFGIDVALSFDPAVLAVVDANPTQTGIQIFSGTCPQPDSVLTNEANNEAGTISYIVTQLNPTPGCDGGNVATIQLQCIAVDATSLVTITASQIATSGGMKITHTTSNAEITCTGYNLYIPVIFHSTP